MPLVVREEDFARLETAWQQLLPRCWANTVFSAPQWQRAWWQEHDSQGSLLLLSVHHEQQLLAIAPLLSRGETVSFLCDPQVCDYLDFLVARGAEEEVFPALLDWLDRPQWQLLDLHCIPEGSPTLGLLTQVARARGCEVHLSVEDVCPGLELPADWEEYLSGLAKKDRHELRRKLRRLSEQDFSYYAIEEEGALEQAMEDFLRLHRASGEAKAIFMTPQRARFFKALGQSLFPAGYLRLFFLEVGGVRVATAMCFEYQEEFLLYNSGYDPDYRSLSVGLLLKAFCIKEAIELGKKRFDFLRGAEPYKYDLGGRDRPIYRCIVQKP